MEESKSNMGSSASGSMGSISGMLLGGRADRAIELDREFSLFDP